MIRIQHYVDLYITCHVCTFALPNMFAMDVYLERSQPLQLEIDFFFFPAQRCLKQKTNLVCIMFVRCKKISFRVCRITFEAIFTLP